MYLPRPPRRQGRSRDQGVAVGPGRQGLPGDTLMARSFVPGALGGFLWFTTRHGLLARGKTARRGGALGAKPLRCSSGRVGCTASAASSFLCIDAPTELPAERRAGCRTSASGLSHVSEWFAPLNFFAFLAAAFDADATVLLFRGRFGF